MKSMDTWARRVKCKEEVPPTFLKQFEEASLRQTEFPITVYAPPDRWARRKANPKLICLWDDRLVIIEKGGREITTTIFLLPDIAYLETGTMLLYSWFKIVGMTAQGSATRIIEYNSVVDHFFRPIAEKMRLAMNRFQAAELPVTQEQEQRKFNIYQSVNYKFMNFAKRSLLPGENVIAQILQPDINLKYLRYFTRLAEGNHLTILTDRELIIIKDAESIRNHHQTRYGGIWSYIPLEKIKDAGLLIQTTVSAKSRKKPEDDLVALKLALENGSSMILRFEPSQQERLEQLVLRIKNQEAPYPKCG